MTKTWRDVSAIYQIYPRSFQDTNHDGIGDLKGITRRLPYLQKLGVDVVWLSPFYPSPQKDFGYDISDYRDIDPVYGSLKIFQNMLSRAHACGIKVMIDLVPNHTSDQHEWFKEARSSKTNSKRDYYVWRDQPNNWVSLAGGSSWMYDETTKQYFLHSFMDSQPDLNWENPKVRAEIKDVMRFWFDMGVDGFRVDAVWVLSKHPDLIDDPTNPEHHGSPDEFGAYVHSNSKNGPRLKEYLSDIASVAAEYTDRFVAFEYYPDGMLGNMNDQLKMIHEVSPKFASPFYFEGLHTEWGAENFGKKIEEYLAVLPMGALPIFCFGNHDQPRIISRFGYKQSRLIAMLQLTLPGIPSVYYGEEIGMRNVPIKVRKDGFSEGSDMGGRDPERTPMQWDASAHAGFSEVESWLPIGKTYKRFNAKNEQKSQRSFWALYKKLFTLRANEETLRSGAFALVSHDDDVLMYERTLQNKTYRIILNFSSEYRMIHHGSYPVLFSTRSRIRTHQEKIHLAPYEGIVISVK